MPENRTRSADSTAVDSVTLRVGEERRLESVWPSGAGTMTT